MSRRAGFLVVTLGAHRTNNGEYLINQSVVTANVFPWMRREGEKDDIQSRDRIKKKQNKE